MPDLKIVTEKAKIHQSVIDSLEDLVQEAKRGEIDGFYGITTKPDGTHESICTAALSTSQKMGCMMQAIIDLANAR